MNIHTCSILSLSVWNAGEWWFLLCLLSFELYAVARQHDSGHWIPISLMILHYLFKATFQQPCQQKKNGQQKLAWELELSFGDLTYRYIKRKYRVGYIDIHEPGHEKMCLMSYMNKKGADQTAHSHSLISAFVVRCLDNIISIDSIAEISRL